MKVNFLQQSFAPDGEDANVPNSSFDGFYALCDLCSFTTKCKPSYEAVKKLCDDHNAKNPDHNAAPVNCVG